MAQQQPQQLPPQQQPSAEDIMKRLRNQVKLAFSDGEESALKVVDVYERQLSLAANQITSNAVLIGKMQEEFKKIKHDISHITSPASAKEPNRKERRKAEKVAAKVAKKAAKTAKKTSKKSKNKK